MITVTGIPLTITNTTIELTVGQLSDTRKIAVSPDLSVTPVA